jgi:hypothetical protein
VVATDVATASSDYPASLIDLGACGDFALLARSTTTCAGGLDCEIAGLFGVSPGTSITGNFPTGTSRQSTPQSANCAAAGENALAAGIALGGQVPVNMVAEMGGLTFKPGVYKHGSSINIALANPNVYLDADGDPNAVFIFVAGSTLTTCAYSKILLLNGAKEENVFWVLGTALTLGNDSVLMGTVLAGSAITINTNGKICGRAIAQTAVTCETHCSVGLSSDGNSCPVATQQLTRELCTTDRCPDPEVFVAPECGCCETGAPADRRRTEGRRTEGETTPIDTLDMGACDDFALLARSTTTCAGSFDCVIGGDLGVSPGTAITGPFVGLYRSTPASSACAAAGLDALNSGIARAGEVAVNMAAEMGGETFKPGLHKFGSGLNIALANPNVYLDAEGNPDAVFIFYAGSTLVTCAHSKIVLLNNAQAKNVFWVLGSALTMGNDSILMGTVLAGSAITINTNGKLCGRAIAQTAITCETACTVGFSSDGCPSEPAPAADADVDCCPPACAELTAITGDVGVFPVGSDQLTGLDLSRFSMSDHSTSTQVNGLVYAGNYAAPTPSTLTVAISDMEAAYTNAEERFTTDTLRIDFAAGLFDGSAGGMSDPLTPGVYTFNTDIRNTGGDIHFAGTGTAPGQGDTDVFIIQTTGDLDITGSVILTNGAIPENIFWQVAGDVTLGPDAHMEGIILSNADVSFQRGSSLNGQVFAQTGVTLQKATIIQPDATGICAVLTNTADTKCAGSAPVAKPFGLTIDNPPPAELFHDISFGGTTEQPSVTFKIDNPFEASADVYVQFDRPLAIAGNPTAYEPVCEEDADAPTCNPVAAKEITAACLTPDGVTPFTLIDVFFAVAEDSIAIQGQSVTIPGCCYGGEEATAQQKKFHYTFVVYCACPQVESASQRRE